MIQWSPQSGRILTVSNPASLLVYGYGNPGRQDDGLGIAFIKRLRELNIPGCTLEENYQLNVEDALLVSQFPVTLFVDASLQPDAYALSKIVPAMEIGFTTHAMHPASVAALCRELYSVFPGCYLLEVRGFEWEMEEGLSNAAGTNLDAAVEYILPLLRKRDPGKALEAAVTG